MATPIITADTPAVKSADADEVDVGLLSTQYRRRSARAFVAALAAAATAAITARVPADPISTDSSHTAVANSSSDSTFFSVTIQAPGLGSRAARRGKAASTRYGAARPRRSGCRR